MQKRGCTNDKSTLVFTLTQFDESQVVNSTKSPPLLSGQLYLIETLCFVLPIRELVQPLAESSLEQGCTPAAQKYRPAHILNLPTELTEIAQKIRRGCCSRAQRPSFWDVDL